MSLTAVVVACASGTTSKATPSTSPAQLQARLLTASDVGTGWQVGPPINGEDLSSVGQSIPCSDVPMDPAVTKRPTAVTGVQFEPTDHSSKHLIELLITGDAKQLVADMQTLTGAMDFCSTKTMTTMENAKLTVKKLTLPKVGDQQAAYTVTDTADSTGTFYVRNAIARVGSVAVAIGLTEIMATPQSTPEINNDTFATILKTGVNKFSH
ncbi:MAG TPA: hypothetical protein VFH56_12090 [Acidimicrobiales bacterium]|nr:hypothetical protein [Acidimicrobiales bacterium]